MNAHELKEAPKPPLKGGETAADLLTPNPVSLRDEATLAEAITLLSDREIHATPVIDAAGHPVGVLSATDILIHERARHESAAPAGQVVRARDLMTPAIFSVRADTPARRVVIDMMALKVHQLFVVDASGVLIGVITEGDLLRHMEV